MARTVDPAKHEAKRRAILDAAVELFARKGFDRTTTADICAAAGISSGSLFHYFPTKRAIFHDIFRTDGTDNAAALAEASTSDDPWAGVLRIVQMQVAPLADRTMAGLATELMAQVGRDEELAEIVVGNDYALRDGLAVLLARAAADGRVDATVPPMTAAHWLLGLVDAMYTRAATDPDFDPAEQTPMLRLIITRFLRPGEPTS